MSLRVLELGPYPPPEGGISRNMLAIREELLARGHSCAIIATSQSRHVVKESDVYHPSSPFALLRLLSSLKFDVLHLHVGGDVSARVLGLAAACSFFGRKKCLLTLHSGAYPSTDEARKASPNSIRGRIFRRFTGIITVNDAIAAVFGRYGVSPDLIKVILPFSLQLPDAQVQMPRELSDFYERHSPVLLSVGGLERDYDPLFQIDAMKEILNEFPNAGLMIVGDGSMQNAAETAITSSGHAGNILIAGNVAHGVTLHLINDADIVLRTTLFDGDAISVREALFLGTPVIATDTNSRPKGIHLIDIGDKSALVNKVKEIMVKGDRKRPQSLPDVANIKAVVDLYEGLV